MRKIFSAPRKGETFELRGGLVSQYLEERKDAIKRVIALMTVGKDVSSLFPDVLKNIATHDLEQKKLVYLYLMNYAKTNPELCILAVNTFVQDTEDPNPLVRSLAIRTMGCIRVDKVVDYMEIPLTRTLQDDNPYVRKTAAICVAKLFDLNSEICVDNGYLDKLLLLVNDSNPMVVANAISALQEIQKSSGDKKLLQIDSKILKKFLLTLNECTEWGRITILNALSDFETSNLEEINDIIEKATPQLQHENPLVVLAAIKLIINHFENLSSREQHDQILKKLSLPLISLLSTPPEIQYVALRNIRIILERYPGLLSRELRVFFVKYSDPLYLKLEKLELLVRLANDSNSSLLLSELKEYSMEVDNEFVSRAIKAIGQLAIKLPRSSKMAVDVLYDLLTTRTSSVIDEGVVVLQNILRRYPKEFITTIIPIIADLSIDDLELPESISSYIWIVGQYCNEIPHLELKLEAIVNNFLEDDSQIQLAILTCIVKVNLQKNSPKIQMMLQTVLNMATQQVENADVRDKAFIYWRLLSSNSELASSILLKPLPTLESTIDVIPPNLLEQLLKELSTAASLYHKPSSMFTDQANSAKYVLSNKDKNIEDLQKLAKDEIVSSVKLENLLDFDDDEEEDVQVSTPTTGTNILDDLNDLFAGLSSAPSSQPKTSKPATNEDLLSLF